MDGTTWWRGPRVGFWRVRGCALASVRLLSLAVMSGGASATRTQLHGDCRQPIPLSAWELAATTTRSAADPKPLGWQQCLSAEFFRRHDQQGGGKHEWRRHPGSFPGAIPTRGLAWRGRNPEAAGNSYPLHRRRRIFPPCCPSAIPRSGNELAALTTVEKSGIAPNCLESRGNIACGVALHSTGPARGADPSCRVAMCTGDMARGFE